jgi:transcription elongation factor GreA
MEMHNTVLSEQMFKILSAHVADIEKEKEAIIKSFYADNVGTGMDIEAFFREYTTAIDSYLNSVKVRGDGTDSCPLIIIGSTVEVRDTSDMDIYSYHIVLPCVKKANRDMSHASCLSPMGRALLLKPVGSKVSVQTPSSLLSYEVMNIALPDYDTRNNRIHLYQGQTNIAL